MSTSEKFDQMDLFRPSLDPAPKTRGHLNQSVNKSALSREQFLDRLIEASRAEAFSIGAVDGFMSTFAKWLNPSDRNQRPWHPGCGNSVRKGGEK